MTNFRPIFENDWCGIETFLKDVLSPVFGDYEQGYDVLTNEPEVREKAKNANITEIRHAATFDFFGSELKVFDITVGDNKKLENNKVGIQAIVRQYINQFEGALIIFHHQKVENQEWRFSYVEKRVNAQDSTSAKRYTYILGKGHPARTIAERFKDLESKKDKDETILLPALTNAFSVAPLSDDFFNEYREHYADLVEYISGKRFVKKGGKFVEEKTKNANGAFKSAFDGDDKHVRDYVKKMMGRLVFLHFLQKKGWLGVPVNAEWGSGDKNFIYNLFKNADENIKSDFLEQALEPLFFNTLNNNRGEEAIAPKVICDIYGSKIRIPYLNGGLFEEDELDTKQVKFKKEHFEELLEFFNQYNFTIDETDPDDQEIGVDPEMLGKIFENLLEDNKDKGAFYTPKEIVQYMCRESLIAYLEEKTGIDTRDFVINHTHTFNESQKANILKALLDVKICDPAVGSGAFPMGMMNELLACTQLLTGETKTRSWLKKHIVKNNIYGVDIEKGAVDIARLRFWLAIIVDEDKPQPLPNLDYKIMQGNSLLECFENIDLSSIAKEEVISGKGKNLLEEYEDPDDAWKEIKNAQLLGFKYDLSEYYDISDHIKKAKLQKDIMDFVKNRIIDKLDFETKNIRKRSIELDAKESAIHSSLKSFSLDSNDPAAIRLRKDLDKIIAEKKKIEEVLLNNQEKQNRVLDLAFNNTEFFLWHTWFGDVFNRPNDCNGFDIVIGNPPYFKYEGTHKGEIDNLKKQKELKSAFGGKLNAYKLFLAKALSSLVADNGIICYIFQNSFLADQQATLLRKEVFKTSQIISIDSYPERDNPKKRVFGSVKMSVCIPLIKKCKSDNTFIVNFWDDKQKTSGISTIFTEKDIASIDPEYYTIPRIKTEYIGLLKKLKKLNTLPLKCYEGELNMTFHKSYFTQDKTKPKILKGASIQRFYYTEQMSQGEIEYLDEKKYLQDFSGEKSQHHNNERIAMQGMTGANDKIRIIMSLVPKGVYLANSCNYLLPTEEFPAKFLLALMNSKLINWYFRCFSTNSNVNGYEVEAFPVPNADKSQKNVIASLVDQILQAKENDLSTDTKDIEKQIDNEIYEIYGLSPEERKIINS